MQQQVLGSNIYNINFFDDLYCYKDNVVVTQCLHIPEQGMIVTAELQPDLEVYNKSPLITKDQQMLVAFEIVKQKLHMLQYPLIGETHLINPFEEKIIDSNFRSLSSLKISPLIFQGRASLVFDVRKINFTIKNCMELARQKSRLEIAELFEGKWVRTIYFQKEYWFKVIRVNWELEYDFVHKKLPISEHMKSKYKFEFEKPSFILQTDQINLKKRYLVPELCELNVEDNSQTDCTSYCNMLVYWNNIFNFNQDFIQSLREYKVVMAGSHVEMSIIYLDPGNLSLANGITKKLSSLVYPRNQSEFDQYYENFFLASKLAYTTNLKIQKWLIFAYQYNQSERESFDCFFETLRNFSNSRNYKIASPEVIDLGESPLETIKARIESEEQVEFVFVVGNKKTIDEIYHDGKFLLLSKGLPNQFMVIPLQKNNIQQVCHRILAQVAAKLGSVAWSIKEINGTIGQVSPCAVLGISVQTCGQLFIVAGVLSVSKSMNKYTSHYYVGPSENTGVKEVTKTALAAFYSAQSLLPAYLIVIREQLYSGDLENELDTYSDACDDLINQIQLHSSNKLAKPTISMLVSTNCRSEKYFTQLANDFTPNYAKHPSVGTLILIDEEKGKFSVCTQRDLLGCAFTSQVQLDLPSSKNIFPDQQDVNNALLLVDLPQLHVVKQNLLASADLECLEVDSALEDFDPEEL